MKFIEKFEVDINNLDKKVIDKENNLRARSNKLNDNVKKINKYNKEKYRDNIGNLDHHIRQIKNKLEENNNLSDV